MSPDTLSSLFPDRPIRPLPKRRLREKLSPEAADSIKYPLVTHGSVPLFHYPPYTLKDDAGRQNSDPASPTGHTDGNDGLRTTNTQRHDISFEDGQDGTAQARGPRVARSPPRVLNRPSRQPPRPNQPKEQDLVLPPSTASSVDGYDSFENTNNKKKRKIPSAGDSAINGSHSLSSEINALALSTDNASLVDDGPAADRKYNISSSYGSPIPCSAGNQGYSGPGRGRLGRSRNGRSPLQALSDGNNTWSNRNLSAGTHHWSSGDDGGGIISSAIANAGRLPPQGQENVSLLQQQPSTPKGTPSSAQFTFTCDSQVPGTVQWPGHPSRQNINAGQASTSSAVSANGSGSASHNLPPNAPGARRVESKRQARRRLDRELNVAAHHRRQVAAENYRRNPPKPEDDWVCEFCEYERIFGEPPRALIRDYEMKARRRRQDEAERKRLLEKAKAKSRKSKRSGKAATKSSHNAQHQADHSPSEYLDDQEAPGMQHDHSHSTQSDDGYDDEFEDEYPSSLPDHIPPAGEPGGSGQLGGLETPPSQSHK